MGSLKRKLSSQTGASIAYALVLFLVCAVVSGIVLTAGTAASGRISGSVDHDQRYYSVTSAAKLLIDLLDGVTVEIQTEQEGSDSDSLGTPELAEGYPVFSKDGTEISESEVEESYGLLSLMASMYVGSASESEEDAWPADEMAISIGGEQNASVRVIFVKEQDRSDSGRITCRISSYDSEDSEDGNSEDEDSENESSKKYSLFLVFDADIKEIEDSSTSEDYSGGSRETTVSVTTTTKMTWTLTSMSAGEPLDWEEETEAEA